MVIAFFVGLTPNPPNHEFAVFVQVVEVAMSFFQRGYQSFSRYASKHTAILGGLTLSARYFIGDLMVQVGYTIGIYFLQLYIVST